MASSLRLALALLFILPTALHAQVGVEGGANKGEFPALQALPVGSVVEGVSIPRYEGARVAALIEAKKLTILTRSLMEVSELKATLYNKGGSRTFLRCAAARYHFNNGVIYSEGYASLQDERFSASGSELYFDTEKNKGLIRGPVRTVINPVLNRTK